MISRERKLTVAWSWQGMQALVCAFGLATPDVPIRFAWDVLSTVCCMHQGASAAGSEGNLVVGSRVCLLPAVVADLHSIELQEDVSVFSADLPPWARAVVFGLCRRV